MLRTNNIIAMARVTFIVNFHTIVEAAKAVNMTNEHSIQYSHQEYLTVSRLLAKFFEGNNRSILLVRY